MSNSYNETEKNNTDDTIVYVPRKMINKLTIENGAKEKVMTEKLNILQDALKRKNNELLKFKEDTKINGEIPIKEKTKLFNKNEEYNILENKQNEENNNISDHSYVSVSSVFKKKGESNVSEKKVLSQQQGGNKSDKKIISHKSEDQKKSESQSSNVDSSEYTDTESSTEYEDTSDIYRATETDDGINKAYYKLNKEMEYVSKSQNDGKMTGKEVVKRINFLLNGLRILDNVKKK